MFSKFYENFLCSLLPLLALIDFCIYIYIYIYIYMFNTLQAFPLFIIVFPGFEWFSIYLQCFTNISFVYSCLSCPCMLEFCEDLNVSQTFNACLLAFPGLASWICIHIFPSFTSICFVHCCLALVVLIVRPNRTPAGPNCTVQLYAARS